MAITVPAACEAALANQPVASRIAVLIDQILALGPSPGIGRTPAALLTNSVAVAATAVTVITGPCNGGFITNPLNAAAQGIAVAENLYLDMVGVPGATDALAFGSTVIIAPGGSFNIPPLNAGVNVKVNAASAGHKISGEVW